MRRCRRLKTSTIALLMCLTCLTYLFYNRNMFWAFDEPCYEILETKENSNGVSLNKKILLWSSMWEFRSWRQPLGQKAFLQCPEQRCEFTIDRCQQPISDAVLFHFPNLLRSTFTGLPQNHPPWQIWVLYVYESELNCDNSYGMDLDGKFNWTLSYRTDSDIFLPYYYFLKILDNPSRLHPVAMYSISDVGLTKRAQLLANNYEESDSLGIFTLPAKPNTDYAKSKARFALWYVSNCQTKGTKKRIEIVKELRKHISIDIYGSNECSEVGAEPDPCDNDETCSSQLMSAYKFYLSFENTQCNYYITEKFFNPLRVGTLPVAFGAPLRSYEAAAPENSFLHVSNFSSLENLANYMKFLDQNDADYNRYFKWKESHVLPVNYFMNTDYTCRLCADLWDTKKKPKVYKNLSEWWNKDKHCIGIATPSIFYRIWKYIVS